MSEVAGAERETVFSWFGGALKFGAGSLDEIGADAAALGMTRVLVVTDHQVQAAGITARAVEALRAAGLGTEVFTDVGIEPTDDSLAAAHAATRHLDIDGIVA